MLWYRKKVLPDSAHCYSFVREIQLLGSNYREGLRLDSFLLVQRKVISNRARVSCPIPKKWNGNGSETEHIPQPGVFKERGIAFTLPLLDNNALTENVKLQFKQNKRLEGLGQRI